MCEGLTLQECMQCPSSKSHIPTAALQGTNKTKASSMHIITQSHLDHDYNYDLHIAIRQNVAATATNSSETDTTDEPVRSGWCYVPRDEFGIVHVGHDAREDLIALLCAQASSAKVADIAISRFLRTMEYTALCERTARSVALVDSPREMAH